MKRPPDGRHALAEPCARCSRLLPLKTARCPYCRADRVRRMRRFAARQLEGGRPFFLAAGFTLLLLIAYVLL